MSLLSDLQSNQEWQAIIKAALKMKPDMPEWKPEMPDSEKEWIYASGMRAGFDLAMQVFTKLK